MRPPLRTLLGDHPGDASRPPRGRHVSRRATRVRRRAGAERAFKRVVRDLEFDVAELALMTFLMARSRGVPLRLLPVVVFSRNPLPHLVAARAPTASCRMVCAARRVGVRAYTTTTAVWIRAMLADQFGVLADTVKWITLEDGHVAGVPDPPGAQRALPAERSHGAAARRPHRCRDRRSGCRKVERSSGCARSGAAYRDWQRRHGARTLNHVIVVRETVAEDEQAMRELFGLFRSSRELAGTCG